MTSSEIEVFSLDITYKCNYRCLHCYNSSGEHRVNKEELSDEELLKVIEDIAAFHPKAVCLCGGEPLIRKQAVYSIARKYHALTGRGCNMVSNGYFLTEEVAQALKSNELQLVQISLDGIKPSSHNWIRNSPVAYEKATSAIANLRKVGLPIGIACAPSKINIGEIDELIEYCISMGVSDFRMQPMMLMGRALSIEDKLLNEYEYLRLSRKIKLHELNARKHGMHVEWGDPSQHLAKLAEGNTRLNFLSISAYGDILISPYLPISFGNIRKHTLTDYLEKGIAFNNSFVKKVASLAKSAADFNISSHTSLPNIFSAEDIVFDAFEDDIEDKATCLIKKYDLG